MKNPTDVFSGILVLIICAIGFYSISTLPEPSGLDLFGPASFPKGILVLLTFCGILLLIKGIRVAPLKAYWQDRDILKKLFFFVLIFYGYLIALTYLGDYFLTASFYVPPGVAFSITTFLFLMIAFPVLGRKNHVQSFIVALCTTGILYAVFAIFFQVILP